MLRLTFVWLRRAILLLLLLWAGLMLAYAFLPPVSTLMAGRWLTGEKVERTYVPLRAMSPHLPLAVIMAEDGRFCAHHGVDWDALGQVLAEADEDGPNRGASTLTMQLTKNLLLWPGRSYLRKALEIPLASVLDLVWTKRRIMEAYLNVAEWGEGIFGAEAAARAWFGKSAAALTPREAALLATALPAPRLRNPARPGRRHAQLAGIVGRRAATGGIYAACLK